MAAGCVSSAIFSTQRIRCLFVVSGLAMLGFPCFILIPLLQPLVVRQKDRWDTAVPQLLYAGPQPPSGFFAKRKPPCKALERAPELWNHSKRYPFTFSWAVSLVADSF